MKALTASLKPLFCLWRVKPGFFALIVSVAIVYVAALVGSQSGQAQGRGVTPQIEGSWLATVTSPDIPLPFPAILTFGTGGALLVTDGSLPPSSGNVYQGTWVRKGGHEVAFSFLGFQFESGVLSGYIRVHEIVRLDSSGSSYSSVISTLEFLDANQNVVFGPVQATTHGIRINAE